ncbi:MAG: molybdopterin molybdotransferase MoeA [Pirellulales bacterium]
MLSPDAALSLVLETVQPLPARRLPWRDALGLVLAEPILADRDYPPFARVMMDGYAVSAGDAGRTVRVAGQVAAGQQSDAAVTPGVCCEVMTGGCCPPGADAVVPKEQVTREDDLVSLPGAVSPGQYIAPPGSECWAGREVLPAGAVLSPLAAAALATFGVQSVSICPRPSLGIVTTGSELAVDEYAPGPVEIRDSNGPMLMALVAQMGICDIAVFRTPDRLEPILGALGAAASKDLVLIAGGVSVGRYDFVPRALEQYGAEVVFHRVAQKPGKPLLMARKGRQILFGLPGNPLGCHLGFHRYVSAAIRRMQGRTVSAEPLRGRLQEAVSRDQERTCYLPALAAWTGDGWRLQPRPAVSSADVFGAAAANAYLHLPPGDGPVEAGEMVEFSLLGQDP